MKRRRFELEEDFLAKYPKHEGAPWVAETTDGILQQQKQYDKALEAAGKGYTGGAGEVDLCFNAVKSAEGKGDAEELKKWAEHTAEVTQKW